MHKKPLVTIYIPTYNRLELLKRAVGSALSQDYKNIELIIVDDGSLDGTVDYLESLIRENNKVKYMVNQSNFGACVSRNRAINAAAGELITGLDDDDYFLPGRISTLVAAWNQRGRNIVAVCSNSLILEKDRKAKKTRRPKIIKRSDLIDSNYIGNQVLTETKKLREIGGFDQNFPAWQDLELWYRLLKLSGDRVECVKNASYVVDMSHPHERISTGRIEKIEKSFQLFSEKHRIKKSDAEILYLQTALYKKTQPNLSSIRAKIARKPSLRNIWNSYKLLRLRPSV